MGLHKDRAEMSQFLSGTWGIKYCAIKEKNTYLVLGLLLQNKNVYKRYQSYLMFPEYSQKQIRK